MDLTKIKYNPSPNCSSGRGGNKVEYIIIHAMVGYFNGTVSHFLNRKSKVSAHYLISKNGEVLQMSDLRNTSWHCHGINERSVGIELEDQTLCMKSGMWVTKELYKTALELTKSLCIKFNLNETNVYGHGEPEIQKINGPRFAHSDPGPYFNMDKFRKDLKVLLDESL